MTTATPVLARPVLEVENLQVRLHTSRGVVHAVEGVSFHVHAGETLGIVGESGCGKTMTALAIQRMLPQPDGRITGGQVRLHGRDLVPLPEPEMRAVRGRHMAMILQDPMSSLNPVLTVGEQIADPLRHHRSLSGRGLREAVVGLLDAVRIPSPAARARAYPHQMSGGMRQRAVGAIALSGQPELLIADEPTTALDVTIQAQYLALLKDLQRDTGVALVLITHDFGIVARMCDRVAVMYAGRIVETAPTAALFDHPSHPYTRALLASLPSMEAHTGRLPAIEGQPPDLRVPVPGCRFAARCPQADARCQEAEPPDTEVAPGHIARCWFA